MSEIKFIDVDTGPNRDISFEEINICDMDFRWFDSSEFLPAFDNLFDSTDEVILTKGDKHLFQVTPISKTKIIFTKLS